MYRYLFHVLSHCYFYHYLLNSGNPKNFPKALKSSSSELWSCFFSYFLSSCLSKSVSKYSVTLFCFIQCLGSSHIKLDWIQNDSTAHQNPGRRQLMSPLTGYQMKPGPGPEIMSGSFHGLFKELQGNNKTLCLARYEKKISWLRKNDPLDEIFVKQVSQGEILTRQLYSKHECYA